jgi:hypothetical protein
MLVNMPTQPSALAKINERNRQFWLKQSELLGRRIQEAALHEIAMNELSAEAAMRVPVRNRKSLEQILARAEKSKTIFQRAFSRNGGKASKPDALHRVIIEIVLNEPDINPRQLLHKIRKMAKDGHPVVSLVGQKSGLICDQAEQIHFKDNGKLQMAPVSGLKDRLSRAKKKYFRASNLARRPTS